MADIRDFKLPDLGEGLEEGDIVEWHVEVGDVIELNQEVASIETAKAVVEVPSPFAGKVVERVGEVGETLEVGSVFLRIDVDVEGGETPDAAPDPGQGGAAAVEEADEKEPQPLVGYGQKAGRKRRRRGGGAAADEATESAPAGSGKPLAKPPVRKLAKDLNVDLYDVMPGSGPDGIITREDVRAAAASAIVAEQAPAPGQAAPEKQPSTRGAEPEPRPTTVGAEPAETRRSSVVESLVAAAPAAAGEKPVPGFRGRRPGEVEKVAGIRKRIIAKMESSRRDIPHALCSRDADLTELWQLRTDLTEQARREGADVTITPTALVMRATVLALRRFPTLNAVYDQEAGEIRLLEHINLGVAVDTDRGLIVPNVKDAHAKSLLQLAAETAELAAKCRDGSATPGELTGGTFTVDNYGYFGNDDGNPIINAPEVGILGIGAIRERPWVVERRGEHGEQTKQIVPRRVARFQLAFDHRVCDGGEAGRFVTYVAELCEQPARILLHS